MAAPLEATFAAALERLGPFEAAPLLAVAVSGGPDSLALALLAHGWAARRGGRIVALTVDHRLRPESAAEAAQAGHWLAARGIAHEILVREGERPAGNLQEAARAARYALLETWCRVHACLHLLAAHHREDQAETLVLRLSRGSGVEGLAAMSAVAERGACRLLRPLLAVPRAALAAYLEEAGQPWIEDPTNRAERFARARIRAALGAGGAGPARLFLAARNLGRARAALERAVDELLARAVALAPEGFALIDVALVERAPEELKLRALARLLTTIGGGTHPPRLERLERFARDLGAGRTLAGCRILPWQGRLLVCREPAASAPPLALLPGSAAHWDGRFLVRLAPEAPTGVRIGAAGGGLPGELPGAAKAGLPALFDLEGRIAVPHLGLCRAGSETWLTALVWKPKTALTWAGFTVA